MTNPTVLPLAVSLHTVDHDQTLDTIGRLAGSSVRAVELWEPSFNKEEAFVAAAREAFAAAGVRPRTVHSEFGGGPDLSSPDEAVRQAGLAAVQRAVELCARMGALAVVVHPSAEPIGDEERPARLATARESLRIAAERAAQAGVRIAVELLPRTCLGRTAEELLALLDGLDPAVVGICLDTNHGMDRHAELPQDARRLGGRLLALHCSDYDGVDEKHWPPLRGVIDWPAFHAALLAVGFDGPLNWEARLDGDTPAARLASLDGGWAALAALLAGSSA